LVIQSSSSTSNSASTLFHIFFLPQPNQFLPLKSPFSSTPQAITQNSFDLLVAGSSAHFLTAQLFALRIISLFLLLLSTRFHFRTFLTLTRNQSITKQITKLDR
jgi:hypothetical protein